MVKIIQLLCPDRHAILGSLFLTDESVPDQEDVEIKKLDEAWAKLVASGAIQKHCGICGSTVLKYEVRNTQFKNLEQAKEQTEALQLEMMAGRAVMDFLGLTFDSRKPKT